MVVLKTLRVELCMISKPSGDTHAKKVTVSEFKNENSDKANKLKLDKK